MDSGQTKTAMTIATLGWLLLVVAVGLFFLIGKPHYYKQGAADQLAQDIQVVDQFLNGNVSAADTPFIGQVDSITNGELILSLNNISPNPLVSEDDQDKKVFRFDDSLEVLVQDYLDPNQYQALVEAQLNPQSPDQQIEPVLPFVELEGTLDQISVGDFISVVPVEGESRLSSEIKINQIVIQVFEDALGNALVPGEIPEGQEQPQAPNTGTFQPQPPQEFDPTPITETPLEE